MYAEAEVGSKKTSKLQRLLRADLRGSTRCYLSSAVPIIQNLSHLIVRYVRFT